MLAAHLCGPSAAGKAIGAAREGGRRNGGQIFLSCGLPGLAEKSNAKILVDPVRLLPGDQDGAARDRASQSSPTKRGALCVNYPTLLSPLSSPHVCCGSQEVQAEREAKREAKCAKREAKRAAAVPSENTPPVACVPIAAIMDGLPVACAVPMRTPVPMPNLARAAAALGVDMDAA